MQNSLIYKNLTLGTKTKILLKWENDSGRNCSQKLNDSMRLQVAVSLSRGRDNLNEGV